MYLQIDSDSFLECSDKSTYIAFKFLKTIHQHPTLRVSCQKDSGSQFDKNSYRESKYFIGPWSLTSTENYRSQSGRFIGINLDLINEDFKYSSSHLEMVFMALRILHKKINS